ELREVRRSTGDVPADDIRVASFELGRPDGARGDDAFPKARREPLDLILDPRAHVDRRAVWDVTVGPERVHAARRAGRVEQAWLHDDRVGPLGVSAIPRLVFAVSDLRFAAPDVDRASRPAFGGAPRHRLAQRPIHLEHAGTVAIACEAASIASIR